ncbi:MAG: hypothetical protein M1818_004007 [Claussenomyces sp. TS43310]|nr:MAG: hypothetical protein M1818_004007 [Claussenomyces sp. TS43310]
MPRPSEPRASPFKGPASYTNTTSSASRKRKLPDHIKYYAVRTGHQPGVYTKWKDCEQNITKFKGAVFKSFLRQADAEAFVAGRISTTSSASPTVARFYGVACGRNPGVYTDWDAAQQQIAGWKGPKYKKFATRLEAEAFVKSGGRVSKSATASARSKADAKATTQPMEDLEDVQDDESVELHDEDAEEGPGKRTKRDSHGDSEFEQGTVEQDIVDLLSVTAEGMGSASAAIHGALRIYTDGSSLGNGKVGAAAGVGVFFGNKDPRNVSEPLQGKVQTNQRAELTAILRALQIAPTDQEVHIYTDSRYSIDCATVWYKNWEENHWMTSLGKPVMNKDLIQAVLALVRQREALGARTHFNWVKGHSSNPSNEAADRLAVSGAMRSGC